MKNEKANAEVAWKQMADLLVPRMRLSVVDRAIYFHLVRHSRLEGKMRLHFSIYWLAGGTLVSSQTARESVRRLVDNGALRLVERTNWDMWWKCGCPTRFLPPGRIETRRARGHGRPTWRTSRKWILWRAESCEKPSMGARRETAFIA